MPRNTHTLAAASLPFKEDRSALLAYYQVYFYNGKIEKNSDKNMTSQRRRPTTFIDVRI